MYDHLMCKQVHRAHCYAEHHTCLGWVCLLQLCQLFLQLSMCGQGCSSNRHSWQGLYQLLGCQVEVLHVIIIIQQLFQQLMNRFNSCIQPHHAILDATHSLQVVCGNLWQHHMKSPTWVKSNAMLVPFSSAASSVHDTEMLLHVGNEEKAVHASGMYLVGQCIKSWMCSCLQLGC